MSRSAKTAVHFYREDGFLVRGTLDPQEALKLAVAADEDYVVAGFYITPDWDEIEPGAIAIAADTLHSLLATAKPGLYRIVPCGPHSYAAADGYRWQARQVDRRGPGVFEGVEFR